MHLGRGLEVARGELGEDRVSVWIAWIEGGEGLGIVHLLQRGTRGEHRRDDHEHEHDPGDHRDSLGRRSVVGNAGLSQGTGGTTRIAPNS